MGSVQPPKLFQPLQVGDMKLSHRVVMSPLTRARCPNSLPTELVAEHYAQRATPGGLLIGEGTHPSIIAGNFLNVPGIFTPEHIEAWKLVTDAVHAKGGYMVCQLWHVGRYAISSRIDGLQPLSASSTNIGSTNRFTPEGRVPTETAKEMTILDIKETIVDHVHAAKCAIAAGFDAVEITSANGYLPNQFLVDKTNLRTDNYGGSIENRCRFTLELLDAVIAAIGPSKTAIRFSPFGTVLMPLDSDPVTLYTYLLRQVDKRRVAYVCLTQPRADLFLEEKTKWANLHRASEEGTIKTKKEDIVLTSLLKVLENTVKFVTGGYNADNCFTEVEDGEVDAVTFGRVFISNPDLVHRIREGLPLSPVSRPDKIYATGPEGYNDYPVASEEVKA